MNSCTAPTIDIPLWSTEPHGMMWMLTRPMTTADRAEIGTDESDSRPMSILGVARDGLACIVEKEHAELIVRAVNSHAELVRHLAILSEEDSQCAPDWLAKKQAARAAIAKAEGLT